MMSKLTVGLAQIYPKLGDFNANLQKHLEFVERGAAQGVQLMIFPEMSLTGYVVQEMNAELATPILGDKLAPLRQTSIQHNMDLVFGFVDVDARQRLFIGQAYISQGRVAHVHHKIYLPTYRVFDDGRYFAAGDSIRAFNTSFGRVGILICEDFWHMSPPYLLWLDGADLLILCSASPGYGLSDENRLGNARWVELVNQAYGSVFTNYVVHCNRVGIEAGLTFWGGSMITDPNGSILAQAPYFDETLLVQMLDLNQIRRTRSRLPLLRDERNDLSLRELKRILGQ